MFRHDRISADATSKTSNKEILNCTICKNQMSIQVKELMSVIMQILKDIEVEQNLTEDWIFNQLIHYWRTGATNTLLDVLMDQSLRYQKEFIQNDRSILTKCLVGDESIGQPMILWISDIDMMQHQSEQVI